MVSARSKNIAPVENLSVRANRVPILSGLGRASSNFETITDIGHEASFLGCYCGYVDNRRRPDLTSNSFLLASSVSGSECRGHLVLKAE